MTLSVEDKAVIRHLHFAQGFSKNAIAKRMKIHHSTVARALNPGKADVQHVVRDKDVSAYLQRIQAKVQAYPDISAKRICDILRKSGYQGSVRSIQRAIQQLRGTKTARAFRKREVFAGEEAQVDWLDLGVIRLGDGDRRVYVFAMVLSWSRDLFACATFDMKWDTFARCHVYGFLHFGGIPSTILYDNLKSVVTSNTAEGIVFNRDFLQFAGEHCFRPKPCNVRQPQEKGRIERAIRYLRDAFFMGREFANLPGLNSELRQWLVSESRLRPWPDQKNHTVGERLERERAHLLPLPQKPWFPKGTRTCRVRKIPYLHFESCQYSVPPEFVGREVELRYDDDSIEIWFDHAIVAIHERCWIKGRIIEDTEHVLALAKQQKLGAPVTRRNALLRLLPSSRDFFDIANTRGLSVRRLEARIYTAVENHGAATVERAMHSILKAGGSCIDSLEVVLSQQPSLQRSVPAYMLPKKAQEFETIHQNLDDYT